MSSNHRSSRKVDFFIVYLSFTLLNLREHSQALVLESHTEVIQTAMTVSFLHVIE